MKATKRVRVRSPAAKGRPAVGIIMGSISDWTTMEQAASTLTCHGVPFEKRVVSSHRTPSDMMRYAETAERRASLP